MGDIPGIFDSLYSRLILRDVFAKILPGTIVTAAVLNAVLPLNTFLTLLEPSLWLALGMLAWGWLAAFAIQGLGERYKFLEANPRGFDRPDMYKLMVHFDSKATHSQQMHAERLLVIKEACGNGSIALLLAAILTIVLWPFRLWATASPLWATTLANLWPFVPLATLYVVAALALKYMHHCHVKHHLSYMEAVIDHATRSPANAGAPPRPRGRQHPS
jgi:hypothetical protein